VALGLLLARKEGQALGQLAQQARQLSGARQRRHDRGLHVQHLFQQARQASEQVAKAASEQYLPKAKEALMSLPYALIHAVLGLTSLNHGLAAKAATPTVVVGSRSTSA
jgi:hypothetical protein